MARCGLSRIAVLAALLAGPAGAEPPAMPAPDPPALAAPPDALVPRSAPSAPGPDGGVPRAPAPLTEWTLHRSADGQHPNGDEQAFVWLMNRARRDPAAEGVFLATLDDPRVRSALAWFDVDLALLQQEFAALAPRPPAAFDRRLWEAAWSHSLYLISIDGQNHDGQFDRIAAAGFHLSAARGNVFSYTESPLYGHAGFNVDWGGNDGTGMQAGRGHRRAIMSSDGDYTNVGIAAVPEGDGRTGVGPLVVTGNYARASTSHPDHHNRFVVGTVWEDLDGDALYDPGEGLEGVVVTATPGAWFAITSAGGGYAIPVPQPASLEVSFSGGGVPARTVAVDVDAASELVDYALPDDVPIAAPEPAAPAGLAVAVAALAALRARRDRSRPRG